LTVKDTVVTATADIALAEPAQKARRMIILKSRVARGGWIVIDIAGRTALALAPPGGNWLHIAALQ
jgi:hypothetical protein